MQHNSRAEVRDKMRLAGIKNGLKNSVRNTFANSSVILRWLMAGFVAVCLWLPVQAFAAGNINIYLHRQKSLIKPFLDEFTKTTGIQTQVVYASRVLAQRLQAEGAASSADSTQRIEDLADAGWQQRICTRRGSYVYNRALMASMIAANGDKVAQSWAEKFVANLARKSQGNNRAQEKAIFQGICDVTIMSSYYYGNMKFNDDAEQRSWADAIRLVFTNQADRSNHINVSGDGVAKHSRNKQQAVAFLEFLTGEVAQQLFGTVNYEYPVNPAVAPTAELASSGPFKRDKLPIERLADLAPQAQMTIDRVGW